MSTPEFPAARPLLPPRPVLADLVPGRALRDAALVAGAALLTAIMAQLSIRVPWSPVPITGQTLAVLLSAAALGPLRGASGQGLYVLLGLVGLPFFAEGSSGLGILLGATGGYLVGFVVAAAVVGACARRGLDRSPATTALAFVAGSAIIYACGVPWLAAVLDVPLGEALRLGLWPFLAGDALKAVVAAGLLPAAWRLTGRS